MIIYKATNQLNGKVYIGQTTNTLEYRMSQHFRETNSVKKNTYFHNALQKYGFDNFFFEEIDSAESIDELNEKEQYWIGFYSSCDKTHGYNLDTGGKNCKKDDRTKRAIGDTTIKKWEDPEMAQKMLDGLRRGTERWKEISQERRLTLFCEYCGRPFVVAPFEAKKRRFCSRKCANFSIDYAGVSAIEAERAHTRNVRAKEVVAKTILGWALQHKDVVLHCRKNHISLDLSELFEMLYSVYHYMDFRSYFICFGVKNKKEFLQYLVDYVSNENIC